MIPGTFTYTDIIGRDLSTAESVNPELQARAAENAPAAKVIRQKRDTSYSTYATNTEFTVTTVSAAEDVVPTSSATSTFTYTSYTDVAKIVVATGAAASASATASGIAYHKVYRQTQQLFSEVSDQAEWGNWYYATANTSALTYQSGKDTDVRGAFLFNGKLSNYQDTNYRAIDDDYPVFGFCVNLGNVGKTTVSSLFTLSLHQTEVIQFEDVGTTSLAAMWTTYWSSDTSAVSYILLGFVHH